MDLAQIKQSVSVEEIVDFDDQLLEFKKMVSGEDEKRLLFIAAPLGRGKTCLLKKMHNHCETEQIPCCFIDFGDGSYDAPHLTLAREICEQLQLSPQHLAQALRPLTVSGGSGRATTEIGGDVINATVITQVLTQIHLDDETLHKTHIVQRLKRAFMDDLKASKATVVCLMDGYEEISRENESWLLEALLSPVRAGALQNMIVITAGERWPKIPDWEWADHAHFTNGLPLMSVEHFIEYAGKVGHRLSREKAREAWARCREGLPILMGFFIKNFSFVGSSD